MNRYLNIGLSGVTAVLIAAAAAGLSAQAQAGATDASATVNLGAVRIPRAVKADGQPLPVGTYQVRVTTQQAQPPAAGQTPSYERWLEFVQGGQVKGREVVSVVPASDIAQVAEMKPPSAGGYRTELLKGGDYLRL